jgi:DNA-binding IclR family transcriptional regulator
MSRVAANPVPPLAGPPPATERGDLTTFNALVRRIRGEYQEMPGLTLTIPQAALLFGVRESTCVRLLRALVEEGFLRQTSAGRYMMTAAS